MDLILHRLVIAAAQLEAADGGIIYLCQDASSVVGVCASGILGGTEGPRELIAGSALQRVIAQRASLHVSGVSEASEPCRVEAELRGARAALHVPCLCSNGSLLAVLTLVARSPHAFSAATASGSIAGLALAIAEVLRRQSEAERTALNEQAQIADSERRFRAFMRALPAVAWIKDADGRYRFVNEEYCRLWNIGPVAALGKTDFDLLPTEVARQLRAGDERLLAQGRVLRMEEIVPTPDGVAHTWLSTRFPLSATSGAQLIAGIAFDISERKRAELALRQSEQRAAESERNLSALLDDLADGIVIHRSGTLVYANEAAAAILGADSAAELVQRSVFDFVAPDLHSRLTTDVQQVMTSDSGTSYLAERAIKRKDGAEVLVESHASRIEWRGAPALAILLRDITERHRRERHMQLSDRLSAAGNLAAAIAHEINNPLSFVSGNLGLIKDELRRLCRAAPEQPLQELERMAADASDGAERIRRIVAAMRMLVRDTSSLERSPVSLAPALDAAIQLTAGELRNRAALVLEMRHTPTVMADHTRLTQVLVNLLTNAAQAITPGDPDTHQVRLTTFTSPKGDAVLEVADDGCGIAPDMLKRIFEPFFTTKPAGVGTGLGLSIVHSIVTSLEGEITVTSHAGKGTTFRVTLPASRVHVPIAPAPARAQPAAFPGGRILIVDDEPAVARVLAAGLSRSFATLTAHSAREGLSILENERVDIVVSDIMMPGMTGVDFFEEIRRRFPHMVPRVVFMSGGSYSSEARAFLASVPNPRVDKPFDFADITELLVGMLQGRERVSH